MAISIILLFYILIGGFIYSVQIAIMHDDEPEFVEKLEDIFLLEFALECLLVWPVHLVRYYFFKIRFSKWWKENICERLSDDSKDF